MAFGERLQALRRARGLTQEDLAAELKVSRQAVSKWELGEPRRSWTSWRLWQRPSE